MVCGKAGRLRLIYWYHQCEDSTVAYSYLCWLRRHGCYWKDLWGKPFASFSSCPYGNEKNSGLLNHTAQDGKGCLGHTPCSSECSSCQCFAIKITNQINFCYVSYRTFSKHIVSCNYGSCGEKSKRKQRLLIFKAFS